MDLNALLTALTAYLGLGAAGAIVLFALAVGIDNVEGVLLAKFKGKDENGVPESFDPKKLGSFLSSQFGTKKAAIVVAAVVAAVAAAVGGQILAGAPEQTLIQVGEAVALSTATAGAGAQLVSVAEDAIAKFRALIAK